MLTITVLRQHGGNVTLAAQSLGISRDTLRYGMEECALKRDYCAMTAVPPRFNIRLWSVSVSLAAILIVNAGLAHVLDNCIFPHVPARGPGHPGVLNSILKAEGTADELLAVRIRRPR